jgi:succinoglycan biosynthesis protein ExoO
MEFSILIPAFKAAGTIRRAVESVISQSDAVAEIVICADDNFDYGAILKDLSFSNCRLVLCRTPLPRSGPSVARNIAFKHSSAEWIASLDADDQFSPRRLQCLAAALEKTGVATGPTIEINENRHVQRVAKPQEPSLGLTVEDISEIRMPYAPAFHRSLFHNGWPELGFAEDMIFNIELLVRAGGYGFVRSGGYRYFLSNNSISGRPTALRRAAGAYKNILKNIHTFDWPEQVRDKVRAVIVEDLNRALGAISNTSHKTEHKWRNFVRQS